jgi:hypothetical protein
MGPRVRKRGCRQQGLQRCERLVLAPYKVHSSLSGVVSRVNCMHVSVRKTVGSSDNRAICLNEAGQLTRAWQQYFNRSAAILLSNSLPTTMTHDPNQG